MINSHASTRLLVPSQAYAANRGLYLASHIDLILALYNNIQLTTTLSDYHSPSDSITELEPRARRHHSFSIHFLLNDHFLTEDITPPTSVADMTMFNRLAAALAACCIIATTLAFPTSPFGTTLPLTAKDTANIPLPTSCTVQENDTFDNYGITVPVAYSADQCTKARDALSDLTTGFEDAWVCESYGDWTILIFSAEKGAAKQVDEAIATAFAQFTFQCANSNAAGSTLVKVCSRALSHS